MAANSSDSAAASEVSTLTSAIVSGDEDAFGKFYDRYSPRIYGLLLVLTSGREEAARELHQIVMIKVARKLRVFDAEPELWAWLSQVARNAFRDYLRKQLKRREASVPDFVDASPDPSHESDPKMLESLAQALQKLDDEERSLIEEFYFDDQTQADIAKAKGQSPKAIESKLARTRAKLKSFLLRSTRHET